MRARIAFVAGALLAVLFTGAPALAEEAPEQNTFPDLPGMKLADEATRGEVAPSRASFHRSDPAPESEQANAQMSGSTPDVSSIAELPGTEQIPVISELRAGLSSARAKTDTMPRGLAALAALGTIVSVGSFLLFRNRLLGR
jgi:hypothetical protein